MTKYVIANADNTEFLEFSEYNSEFETSSTPTLFNNLSEANEAIAEIKSEYSTLFQNQIKYFLVKEATITIE